MLNFSQYIKLAEGKKPQPKSVVDIMKDVARKQRLKKEQQVGRPVAKSWGGRPTPRQDRRDSRRNMRDI
jgi:hypothetical protein